MNQQPSSSRLGATPGTAADAAGCGRAATERAMRLLLASGLVDPSAVRRPVPAPPAAVGLWAGYDRRLRR